MEYLLDQEMLGRFREALLEEEKSDATIEKYMRDIQKFYAYTGEPKRVNKEVVIQYKRELLDNYAVTSVNSMLAALNRFFKYMNWYDCMIKAYRVQKESFRSRERELTKEEYYRLLRLAKERGKMRLYYLMETICSTGIRISELRFITVQAIHKGEAKVSLKGKLRTVLLPTKLCRELKKYIKKKGIINGSIFVTRTGMPVDRSNVLHEMKALCEEAGVDQKKVFPHNLRHLFACTYYQLKKDITHLADLLGHSSINTTRIYTQISGKEQVRQINQLGLII